MEPYWELITRERDNHQRLKHLSKRRQTSIISHDQGTDIMEDSFSRHGQPDSAAGESFSTRMIAVMLILVTVMFVKQSGLFNDSAAYQSVMAEIHRQVTAEDMVSAIQNDAVYPVMNWLKGGE